MAQRILVQKTCDIAGEDTPAIDTYEFAFGGDQFSIDLGEENAKLFEAEMTYWSSNAIKAGASTKVSRKASANGNGTSRRKSIENGSEVRAWARDNGWPELGDRGRVSEIIKAAYAAAIA